MCVIRHPNIISTPIQCLLSFSFQECFRFLNNVIQRPFIGVSWRYQIICFNDQIFRKTTLCLGNRVFFVFFQSIRPEIIFSTITRNAININDLVNEYLLTLIFQGYLSNKTKNSSRNVLIYWIFLFFLNFLFSVPYFAFAAKVCLYLFLLKEHYTAYPYLVFDLLCLLIMVWRIWFCIFFCFKWGIRLNAMYIWIWWFLLRFRC